MSRHVYIAGPLFDEGERWWIEQIEAVVAGAGLTTYLPHRDNPPKTADNVAAIFASNREALDNCSMVIASLNGITTDDGTAWEIGYAYGKDKPIVGVYTDWRSRFPGEVVNLMIESSLTHLIRSLPDLGQFLRQTS